MSTTRIIGDVASRHRHLLMLFAALVCAALAVYAANGYMQEQLEAERSRHLRAPVPMVPVIVARRDLRPGDSISAETMAVRSIPKSYAMQGAIRPEQFDTFDGARLTASLGSGEQLLLALIAGRDSASFSSRLSPGVRALTIAVDEINSISGMLQPGDRVDLFFSARQPEGRRGTVGESTLPLQQNLLVLATGRQVRPVGDDRVGGRGFSSITVELPPNDAQKLVVAQRTGRLTAVLRNPDDRVVHAAASMDLRHLFGPVEKPRTRIVYPQVIIGGSGRLPSALASPTAILPAAPASAAPDGRVDTRSVAVARQASTTLNAQPAQAPQVGAHSGQRASP